MDDLQDLIKPKRTMTLLSVVALGIGSMLGAGIFALLGQIIATAGQTVYLAFGFAGIIAMLSGYSYAKLEELYPSSGGITTYFSKAFNNRFWAGLFSGIYLTTLCVSIAVLGKSFGIYFVNLFSLSHHVEIFYAAGILLLIGLFNMNGSEIGKTEVVLVSIKISILLILIAMTFYQYFFVSKPAEILHPALSNNFWKSVSYAFFAYAGYGVMTNTAGDVKNPRRTIPIAIFVAILTVMALYMALSFVVMSYAPLDNLQKNVNIAIAVASEIILGKYGFILISSAALIAILSGINALFYSSYKIMSVMCENKELPKILGLKLIGKSTLGMVIITISVSASSFIFNFSNIATIASLAFLASYIAVFIAHLLLFKKNNSSLLLILLGLISMSIVFVQNLLS